MKKIILLVVFVAHIQFQYAQKAEVFIPISHSSSIYSIVQIPNTNFFISGGNDGNIKLWDYSTHRLVRTFLGHTGVRSVCLHPDGKKIISAGDIFDRSIRVWDIETGKELIIIKNAHNKDVNCIDISNDGKTLVSCSRDSIVKLWDIEKGSLLRSSKRLGSELFTVKFSPDGSCIAVGGTGNTIKFLNINLDKTIKEFQVEKEGVKCLVFSPNGKILAAGGADNVVRLWDVEKSKPIETLKGHKEVVNTIAFSSDGLLLASGSGATKEIDNGVRIWDVKTGKCLSRIKPYVQSRGLTFSTESVEFINNNKSVLVGSYDVIVQYNVNSSNEEAVYAGYKNSIVSFDYSDDNKLFVYGNTDGYVFVWDNLAQKLVTFWKAHDSGIGKVAFTKSNSVISSSFDNTLKYWKVSGTRVEKSNEYSIPSLRDFIIKSDQSILTAQKGGIFQYVIGKQPILVAPVEGLLNNVITDTNEEVLVISKFLEREITIYSIKAHREIKTLNANSWVTLTALSPDNNTLAVAVAGGIQIWSIKDGEKLMDLKKLGTFNSLCFSKDGKYLLSGGTQNTVICWDLKSGAEIDDYYGLEGTIKCVAFNTNEDKIISAGTTGEIVTWNRKGNKVLYKIIGDNNGWVAFTPEGYYDCSNNSGELLQISQGYSYFNIDQFALKYNRPDLLLKLSGSDDSILIQHFYNQYKKRLRKAGILEEKLLSDLDVPSSTIKDIKQNGKFLTVNFSISGGNYNLIRYNIYVNDIPLFGSFGKMTSGNNKDLSERIELVKGKNKIEISCVNEKGSESLRSLKYIDYNEKTKSNLYFLAFGVSKYQNSAYNLQFADKDALDLSKVIESFKGKGFANVYTKVLTNEQVTPDAIKTSKDFVKNAKPDDTFILFIAGHGMHDNDAEATYYFLTSNADVNNLKGTAADFETIEDLLQGISPRNKLFLMDACESGEIDDEEQGQMIATATGVGIASRGFKTTPSPSTTSTQSSTKRSYLYQKDRYIYNDLVRRSGAIVFSSSKGGELSYERSDIENGLFTEYIMKALTTDEADKDNNGFVSTDELREYVSARVAKASSDLQHPTVDRDNIYQKFGFMIK